MRSTLAMSTTTSGRVAAWAFSSAIWPALEPESTPLSSKPASGAAAEVDAASIPFLAGALDLAREGVVPAGTRRNASFLRDHVRHDLAEHEWLALADAQTSGGLLVACTRSEDLRAGLEARGVPAAEIGRVVEGDPGRIRVVGRPS